MDLGAGGIATYGALWAVAAIGFVVAALAFWFGWAWWQPALLGVTLLSLVLTALDWNAVFWSLWHLPLFLNGFYPADLVTGMTVGGIYRVLLAIFLTWFYNRAGGNLFLLVFLHTSFNVMVNYLPFSTPVLAVLWLIVAVVVVLKDKMYQKLPSLARD